MLIKLVNRLWWTFILRCNIFHNSITVPVIFLDHVHALAVDILGLPGHAGYGEYYSAVSVRHAGHLVDLLQLVHGHYRAFLVADILVSCGEVWYIPEEQIF